MSDLTKRPVSGKIDTIDEAKSWWEVYDSR